ncbi:MAG: hypothetical protein LLG37_07920, partial [Spirochaetia bacterium]|nr:hypothetical protein [Spirochaetia bacterium]
ASVTFTGTAIFSAANAGPVYMPAGVNELKLDDMWGWLMLDWFGIEPIPAGGQFVSGFDLMPASVSTEQQDVYAIMYTIRNPSGGIGVINGITLTVKDSNSNPIMASAALSSLAIRGDSGTIFQTTLIPAGPQIYCNIPAGIQVGPYSEKNIYITADITSNTITRASDFKIGVDSALGIKARDFSSGNTLAVASDAGFSFPLESSAALIQNMAKELTVSHLSVMPSFVSTGQKNVKAMEFLLFDVGNSLTASVKVSKITLYMQDAAGNCISASSAVKSVKITGADGSVIYGETTAGGASKIAVVLTAPLIVSPGQLFICDVTFDARDSIPASAFRLSLDAPGDIYAVDANSNVPVLITSASAFPKNSGASVTQDKAYIINMDNFSTLLGVGVVKGQKWVELFDFRIYDTLGPQSAAAHFNALTITVKNNMGAPAPADSAVEKFYITDNSGNTLGSASTGTGSDTRIELLAPFVLTSGMSQYFRVFADIPATAYAASFRAAIQSANNVSITDANSGYEASELATPAMPWQTGLSGVFLAPATDLFLWHNGNIAPTIAGMGQPDVKFMSIFTYNPGYVGTADVMMGGLTLTVVDGGGNTIAPSSIFEKVYVTSISGDITYAVFSAVSQTAVAPFYVQFSSPVFTEAMNTKNVYISADIAVNAGQGIYRLKLGSAVDVGRASVPSGYVTVTAANSDLFPMYSNPVTITALAYELRVGHENLMPVSIASGMPGVEALSLKFENYNAVPIAVTSLAFAVKNCTGQNIAADSVISAVVLTDRENNIIASGAAGGSSGINVTAFDYNIPPGAEKEIKVKVDAKNTAAEPFYLELETGAAVSTLPLALINAVDGDFFGNMKSGCVSIQSRNLEGSFHLFPNPFTAGVEQANIEYYLEHASEVTIRIFTMEGRLVKEIASRAARNEGLHYEDAWNGKNESGQTVRSGIYLCVLEVRNTASGATAMIRGKVAVLR